MRFVPPMAALRRGPTLFDGDPHARNRPMGTIIEALTGLGVAVGAPDGGPAPRCRSPCTARARSAAGTSSSTPARPRQFVSALLLVGARFTDGLHLEHAGDPGPRASTTST